MRASKSPFIIKPLKGSEDDKRSRDVDTLTLPANETVLRVPQALWRAYSADHAIQEFARLSPDTFGALVAMSERMLPNKEHLKSRETFLKSFSLAAYVGAFSSNEEMRSQHPYLALLRAASYPEDKDRLPHPLLMNKEKDIDPFLRDTRLHRDILIRNNMYEKLSSTVFEEDKNSETVRDFLWGMGTVVSRGLSSDVIPLSLVPMLDFANHADDSLIDTNPKALPRVNLRHHYDDKEKTFSLITERDISPGEPLCITYGATRDNSSFITLYSFLGHYRNKNDKLFLKVEKGKTYLALKGHPQRQRAFKDTLKHVVHAALSDEGKAAVPSSVVDQIVQQIVVQDDGSLALVSPLFPSDAAEREATAQLLAWSLKLARESERDNRILNKQGKDAVLQLTQCSPEDWQAVQTALEQSLLSVYLTREKKDAFGFSPAKNQETSSEAEEFAKHLQTIAERIEPSITDATDSKAAIAAPEYWKSCCARILQLEIEAILEMLEISR